MERQEVQSSNLRSVGYDDKNSILEVEFLSSSVYRYFNVPEQIYQGLLAADSHGKFFHEYIKKGGYRYEQVR